jgi:hypothetical protein
VAWIAVVGVLLAGVVATNVAVLRLNLSIDSATQRRVQLESDIATLSSRLSSELAAGRIQSLAQANRGLRPAQDVTYVDLGR